MESKINALYLFSSSIVAVNSEMASYNSTVKTLPVLWESNEPATHIEFASKKIDQLSFCFGILHQKATFFEDLSRMVVTARAKMAQNLEKMKFLEELPSQKMSTKNLIAEFKKRTSRLDSDISYLLEEGILLVFLDLLDLTQKTDSADCPPQLLDLIKDSIGEVSDLLKLYFWHYEYVRRQQEEHPHKVFTSKSLNQPVPHNPKSVRRQSLTNLEVLGEVRPWMETLSIDQLIGNYLQKEIMEMKEKKEICSICFSRVKLQDIQRHVQLCRKISDLNQSLQELILREEVLQAEARQILLLNSKDSKHPSTSSLKRVITSWLTDNTKKVRKTRKRSLSNLDSKSQRCISPRWELYLEEHENLFGEQPTLTAILGLHREKIAIERSISGLQNLFLSENRKTRRSQLAFKLQALMETTKSIGLIELRKKSEETSCSDWPDMGSFCQQDQIKSDRDDSEEDELSQPSCSLDSLANFQQTLKSMRSRRFLNSPSLELEDEDKKFLSLHDLPLLESRQPNLSLENFEILKILGEGTFGKVYLVRRKETGDIYALKIVCLPEESSEKDLECIQTEHQIFKKIAGDHLVKAPFSFTEKDSQIFVMEFMPGGDLRQLLNEEVYFEEEAARFYLAEMVMAIEHLHNFSIIHRDLKPENLVIDEEGHIKLTDFGLSAMAIKQKLKNSLELNREEKDIKRTNKRRVALRLEDIQKATIIGSPDYIAPEIVNHISTNNKTIDWWSLGVMAYELIIGTRPFCADTVEEVVQNIRQFNIEWPDVGYEEEMISPQAKDLIQQLLNKDFMNRLGARGAAEIKVHPFFKGVNWHNLKNESPPFQPNVKTVNNFRNIPEDRSLREQLESHIRKRNKSVGKLKLQRFVRYDLLGSETMEKVEKIFNQKTDRLRKLNTCLSMQAGKGEKGSSISYTSLR